MRFEAETQTVHRGIRQASKEYELALVLADIRFDDVKDTEDEASSKPSKN